MSIRKVTSSLNDPRYVRALEAELAENRIFRKSALGRIEDLEKRPRAAVVAIPAAPVGLGGSYVIDGTGASISVTFAPVTVSVAGRPIVIDRHELQGKPAAITGVPWVPLIGAGLRNWYGIDVSDDGTVIVGAGGEGGIFVSSNTGTTWSNALAVAGGFFFDAAVSSDGSRIVAVGETGLWTSVDSGTNWTKRSSMNSEGVASSADGSRLVAGAAYPSSINMSSDSGATWTARDMPRAYNRFASSDSGATLVACLASNPGYVATSADSGESWTEQVALGERSWRDVACSNDGARILATSWDGTWVSVDGGETWTEIAGGAGGVGLSLSFDASRIGLATVTEGGVLLSHDSGETWKPQSDTADPQLSLVASSSDGTQFVAAGQPSYLSRAVDDGSDPNPGSGGGGAGASVWRGLGSTSGDSGRIDYWPLPLGKWDFRVRAVSAEGAAGGYSEPFQMTLY